MTARSTDLIHHPYTPPTGFAAPQVGVYKASTVIFPSVAALRERDWRNKSGYTYGLHGTPTSFQLEERLATLEGGKHCLLVPSGLAAITHVCLALLASGDEVLIPDNVYGPSRAFAEGDLARFGITHQRYDPLDANALKRRLSGRTKLVWVEAPGSVTMEFPPVAELARACRERGILVALDNTWGAGLAFNGFEAGADIVVQALTKYPSGGGDVLMGSIVTRDDALHERLKLTHMRLGWGVGANDAEAVLRSLPSLQLRYKAQDHVARILARWLQARPEVALVLHPALEGSPGHDHWKATCGGQGLAAGLFSIVLHDRFGTEKVDRFCEALKLFKLGYSWGGPVSLVVPYDIASMRRAGSWPHRGVLVRFSIGLEEPADLHADLEQALRVLA